MVVLNHNIANKVLPKEASTQKEKRISPRTRFNCFLSVYNPFIGEQILSTKDVSATGLYLNLLGHPLPPIGSELIIEVITHLPIQQKRTVKVVRCDDNGVGLQFLS
ncbi:PilZ domain-containing protein [Marinibactrum halimedae]|uniref:PilZ domain-containing protein n=1 Tax=Marinibactrum halimedae TaxID=1444977 RepID=A0AA37WKZ3_9GAMM|nr:PilZ domain-containing protein [Marinibactrum halimedae]MCD9458736.1 PilZ domain-containing protein [Marinibactrum halimedae]GLS25293.1 hypothetical protein GCM10007877_10070 [Marinibactrum halimedae]